MHFAHVHLVERQIPSVTLTRLQGTLVVVLVGTTLKEAAQCGPRVPAR